MKALFNPNIYFQSGQIYCYLKTCDVTPGCSKFYQSPDTCCPICVGTYYSEDIKNFYFKTKKSRFLAKFSIMNSEVNPEASE